MKSILQTGILAILLWQGAAHANALIEIETAASSQNLYHNFGLVRVNSTEYVDLRIRNAGGDVLTFDRMQIYGTAYGAFTDCPYSLQPGEVCNVTTSFSPPFESYYSGALIVDFDNGDSIQLDLDGRGVRRY